MQLSIVRKKLIEAVKSKVIKRKACFRMGDELSKWFPVRVSLRQEYAILLRLFSFLFGGVVRRVSEGVYCRVLEVSG